MLKSTFCHLPDTDCTAEEALWKRGIRSWEDLLSAVCCAQRRATCCKCKHFVEKSFKYLEKGNSAYFAQRLPPVELWRIFPQFLDAVAYVDIETTGLRCHDYITTIALYDGANIFHFVCGDDLTKFKSKIKEYKLLVTYNGKAFDVPFIERTFGMSIKCPHIDLRYLLQSLGITGGLKGCEKQLGIKRPAGLADLDGAFAVSLWNEYKTSHNEAALQTLLAYNVQDVISLEKLFVIAYNWKTKETPFGKKEALPIPKPPDNPFSVNSETVHRIQHKLNFSL